MLDSGHHNTADQKRVDMFSDVPSHSDRGAQPTGAASDFLGWQLS